METLMYWMAMLILIALVVLPLVVVLVIVGALLTIATGSLGLLVARFKRPRTKKPWLTTISAGLLAVGLVCLSVCTCTGLSVGLGAAAQWWRYERATCLELPLSDDFKLQIIQFQDGTYKADLRDSDGSSHIQGITHYAIVEGYLLGENDTWFTSHRWFWFDLSDSERLRYGWSEIGPTFPESLDLPTEPVFLPIAECCETETCQPCATPPVEGSGGPD
jgi:hypothetical protein